MCILYHRLIDWAKGITHTHLNPLSPHDALKHHSTALKTDLIVIQPRVLE